MREVHLGADRAGQIRQVPGQVDQEVVDRDHAGEPTLADDGEPAHGLPTEEAERVWDPARVGARPRQSLRVTRYTANVPSQ